MGKRKKDPYTIGLGSPNVEGQGTTIEEIGKEKSSARKKNKRL